MPLRCRSGAGSHGRPQRDPLGTPYGRQKDPKWIPTSPKQYTNEYFLKGSIRETSKSDKNKRSSKMSIQNSEHQSENSELRYQNSDPSTQVQELKLRSQSSDARIPLSYWRRITSSNITSYAGYAASL